MTVDNIPVPEPLPADSPLRRTDKRGSVPGQKGNPPHQKTPEISRMVEALVAYGNRQKEIATILDISVDTLDKHYRRELDTGALMANSKVAERLYRKALEGDNSAMQYWLSRRAKWTEITKFDHSSSDGTMTPTVIERVIIDPEK